MFGGTDFSLPVAKIVGGQTGYFWQTPTAPEARGILEGAGPGLVLSRIPVRRPCRDANKLLRPFLVVALGLHHRLISVAHPGREIASLGFASSISLKSAPL